MGATTFGTEATLLDRPTSGPKDRIAYLAAWLLFRTEAACVQVSWVLFGR